MKDKTNNYSWTLSQRIAHHLMLNSFFVKDFGLFNGKMGISIEEANNHKTWRSQNDINGTPTILINGYELPYYYKLEDIAYFSGLKIE